MVSPFVTYEFSSFTATTSGTMASSDLAVSNLSNNITITMEISSFNANYTMRGSYVDPTTGKLSHDGLITTSIDMLASRVTFTTNHCTTFAIQSFPATNTGSNSSPDQVFGSASLYKSFAFPLIILLFGFIVLAGGIGACLDKNDERMERAGKRLLDKIYLSDPIDDLLDERARAQSSHLNSQEVPQHSPRSSLRRALRGSTRRFKSSGRKCTKCPAKDRP